jgi:hypothetical protein
MTTQTLPEIVKGIVHKLKFRQSASTDETWFTVASHKHTEVILIAKGTQLTLVMNNDCSEHFILEHTQFTAPINPMEVYEVVEKYIAGLYTQLSTLSQAVGRVSVLVPKSSILEHILNQDLSDLVWFEDWEDGVRSVNFQYKHPICNTLLDDYKPYMRISAHSNKFLCHPPKILSSKIPKTMHEGVSSEYDILKALQDMEQQVCKFFTKVHLGK